MVPFSPLQNYQGPVPLFPLPNVVFFPHTELPLHIFEPRYREMVQDAMSHDGLIGMVLLKAGWEKEYQGKPPIYRMGCLGRIDHIERFPDGRYNLVLRGINRFLLTEIESGKSIRKAKVEMIRESDESISPRRGVELRNSLFEAFSKMIEPPPWGFTVFSAPNLSLGILGDMIASCLPIDVQQKQRILEAVRVESRISALVKILEQEDERGRRVRIKQLPFVRELARS